LEIAVLLNGGQDGYAQAALEVSQQLGALIMIFFP